ncbi:hypothetical protein CLV58_109247 [Spirosoma oryzae]|uniref:Putative endonuclease SegE-like GIY-YIG domain-containing protein n=1 Tax=Spirosoma oryzae TaxID=1469603 RepID=A0A2T0SYM7_9BACT|nr:hypothetical protein [Spirosoma oryzae]PRY38520.1 hypothetical protein CLV58_109247 [Spirosoma oryzae]
MNPWLYDNQTVKNPPEGSVGFCYKITFKPNSNSEEGIRHYIGRKTLFFKTCKRAPKAQQLKIDGTPRKNVVKIRGTKASDWETYMGSNKTLIELAKNYPASCFTRVILQWAYSSRELSYLEDKYLHQENVLENPVYLNDNVAGRHFRSKLFPLLNDT